MTASLSLASLAVLDLLSRGWTRSEVGQELNLSTRQVRYHLELCKFYFQAKSVPHLVRIALENHLIEGTLQDADLQ